MVRVWDAATGRHSRALQGRALRVFSVAFSPDGTRVAGTPDRGIKVWDAANGRELLTVRGMVAGLSSGLRPRRHANRLGRPGRGRAGP